MSKVKILRRAKKRRGLTIKDYNYFLLEGMVHEGVLDKTYPKKGRGVGWPLYKISRRGKRFLEKVEAKRRN